MIAPLPPLAVLLVSDLPALRAEIASWLAAGTVTVVHAETSASLRLHAAERTFQLIIWDASSDTFGVEDMESALANFFTGVPVVTLNAPEPGGRPRSSDDPRVPSQLGLTREAFLAMISAKAPQLRRYWAE